MTTATVRDRPREGIWPSLPYEEWKDTLDTLHRWVQVVGKTRLKLAPAVNHSWHVTLYLTSRGLTTSPMPCRGRTLEVELDFIEHRLLMCTSRGERRELRLEPQTVADFYHEYLALLESLGIEVPIWPVPSEMADVLPFSRDHEHRSYQPDHARRCWTILSSAAAVLQEFRGGFIGKCSPVHFFWGAFDLACTRFSGRPAPPHPGGVPNLPDRIVREAYSHECISAGWWPGGGPLPEPVFYSYVYPEPSGFSRKRVGPDAAYYHDQMKEFVLPYEAVRRAASPEHMLMEFLETTYRAGAELAGWDRKALERPSP